MKIVNQVFKWFLILLIYLILALIFTFPVILHLNNSLVGSGGGDGFVYLWNIFEFWNELMHGNNPFFSKIAFYPIGANLAFHTYAPLISILGFPFLNNLIFFLNAMVVCSLVFASFTAFNLIKFLTKNDFLSLIAGPVYGFSPIMVSFLLSQHYYFAFAAGFLPLGLLVLLKFFQTGGIKYLSLIFLFFWTCFFIDYYTTIIYIIMCIIISFVLLLNLFFRDKYSLKVLLNKKKIFTYFLIFSIFLIAPSFILFRSVFHSQDFGNWISSRNNYSSHCGTNLAGFLIPNKSNPFLGGSANFLHETLEVPKQEDTPSYYLGISFLILTVFSFIKLRKSSYLKAIACFGITIFLLSMGTVIRFGKLEILSGQQTPFYWFSKLPFLGLIDCPLRFSAGIQLTVTLVTAMLIGEIASKGRVLQKLMLLGLLTFFLFEYSVTNLGLETVYIPRVYQQIAIYNDNYTVLEIPSGISESKGSFGNDYSLPALHSKQMYWQTAYKKPKVGGYISRIPGRVYQFYQTEPILSDIFAMTSYNGSWPGKYYTDDEVDAFINRYNLGYIIFSPGYKQREYFEIVKSLLNKIPNEQFNEEGFILLRLK